MRRDAATETKPKDSSESSSEESLDKLAADLGKVLGPKENEELKKVIDSVNSAKTEDEKTDAYVRNVYINCTRRRFVVKFRYSKN